MDMPTTITVIFQGGMTVAYHDHTVWKVAKEQLELEPNYPRDFGPLLFQLENGQKLFFMQSILQQYVSWQMDYEELVSILHCDGLYRNRTRLINQHKFEIEPQSLWLKRGDTLMLIDDDNFIDCDFNEKLFEQIA